MRRIMNVDVHVDGIRWMDENEEELTEAMQTKLGLPTEETLTLDGTIGDWSEAGLELQCIEALNHKYQKTGMTVSYLLVDYP